MSKTNTLAAKTEMIVEPEVAWGSPNLAKFISSHKDLLKADVILISDSAMISLENPSINIGVRGLSYIEVEVTGPNRDLHSGTYGGAVTNPINALCHIVDGLRDARTGKILIPGLHDHVR